VKVDLSYERWRDWLEEAEDDLSSAKILAREGKYGKACFLAQQSAEKAVKSFLVARFKRYEVIHSVSELLKRAEAPQNLIELGVKLDRHYIPSRYPNAWPFGAPFKHYRSEDAEEALRAAEEILGYVRREIEGSN